MDNSCPDQLFLLSLLFLHIHVLGISWGLKLIAFRTEDQTVSTKPEPLMQEVHLNAFNATTSCLDLQQQSVVMVFLFECDF